MTASAKVRTVDDIRREVEKIAEAERLDFYRRHPEEAETEQPVPEQPDEPDGGDYQDGNGEWVDVEAPGPEVQFDSKFILSCIQKNQIGDSVLFKRLHRGKFIYDHAAGRWYRWAGHCWEVDTTETAFAAVQEVTRVYKTELDRVSWRINSDRARGKPNSSDEWIEKVLRKRIAELQTRQRVNDILVHARSGNHGLCTPGNVWDADPMLICCDNCVIDLRTGNDRPGRPSDMIKTRCPIAWTGLNTPAPIWEEAIRQIFPSEVVFYVHKLIGYSITGKVVHHILIICHGTGANGKSLFFETLGGVLGDLAYQVASETLLSGKDTGGGQSRSDIMALRGRRLCYTQEINSRRSLDLAKSKLLTGNDTVSARELYGRQTTFKPSWKLFMITNARPNADANDYGIWRRLVLLPFEYSFVENPTGQNERPIDYDLPEKLKSEYSGILAWAVRGCLKWQAEGLIPPDRVKMATEEYRTENDTVQQFISDCCLVSPGVRSRPQDLFKAYQTYCSDEGIEQDNQTSFFNHLKARYKREKNHSGRWYSGITLKSEYET